MAGVLSYQLMGMMTHISFICLFMFSLGEFYAMVDFVNPTILGNLATFSRTFMQVR